MKTKWLITAASVGIIIGFIVGFIPSVQYIISHHYIQYKMFRLVAFVFQTYLNRGMIMCTSALLVLFLLLLLILFITRFVWKPSLLNNLDVQINDPSGVITILLICSAFFFYGGWAINHYWLPNRFHPVSLLSDLGILFAAIFLGWLLMRLKWGKIFRIAGVIRKAALVLVIVSTILNLGIFIDGKINAPRGPNVIVLLIDALRKDHVGVYGYSRNTTPNIDRFSQDAVIFQHAISQCSWTSPSIASLFSSLYPSTHGFISFLPEGSKKMAVDLLE